MSIFFSPPSAYFLLRIIKRAAKESPPLHQSSHRLSTQGKSPISASRIHPLILQHKNRHIFQSTKSHLYKSTLQHPQHSTTKSAIFDYYSCHFKGFYQKTKPTDAKATSSRLQFILSYNRGMTVNIELLLAGHPLLFLWWKLCIKSQHRLHILAAICRRAWDIHISSSIKGTRHKFCNK